MEINEVTIAKKLINLIDDRIKSFLNNFTYITEKEGRIATLIDLNEKYKVTIDGVDYDIPKKPNDDTMYQVGDIVMIKLSNGNFNRKYIECKRINW